MRRLFAKEYVLASDWYAARLRTKQERDKSLWRRHVAYLSDFVNDDTSSEDVERLKIRERLAWAKGELEKVWGVEHLHGLVGTIGADPMGK